MTATSSQSIPGNQAGGSNPPPIPPLFGEKHNLIKVNQDGFDTQARVTNDGRVNININQKNRKLSDLLVPALRSQLSLVAAEASRPISHEYVPPALGGLPGQKPPPKLNVVIHVVGSRGDVQPFVALGKTLKATYGHRVRLATHATFKGFVEENGLEFFSIGGDPSELMAFMVKNPGLMPGLDALKSGDVGKRRKGMEEIVLGCWRSCIEAGDGTGPAPPTQSSNEAPVFGAGIDLDAIPTDRPFIADAIIANPPSFAHVHIAEKMGIPLHMMFTMPWSPTQSFPHPLANIQSSNADVNMTNFVTYALVEMMTWQGLGDVINRFREKALGLDAISLIWAPGMLSRLRIPYTYCWSPALIPKPKDWGRHISISGFYFLPCAPSFTPEPGLAAFLADGSPPVYIGFGSIIVDDPNAMTTLVFEAVKKAGVRALVSKGWGGLGGDALSVPEDIFMLGNVPHDWLFQHVSCVVHHGGGGTTAAGIALGKPTIVVPFFGDQPFWGAMTTRAGAGPQPIPYKQLTSDKLAHALAEALEPRTLAKAKALSEGIKEEKGTETGGQSFHDNLDLANMRCSLAPNRVAVWRIRRTNIKLSALAAHVLASENHITFADLKLHRSKEYQPDDGPWDPISGAASALLGTFGSLAMGVADFPVEIFKAVKQKAEQSRKENKLRDSSGSSAPTVASTPCDGSRTDQHSIENVDATSSLSASQSPGGPTPPTSSDSILCPSTETTGSDTPATSISSIPVTRSISSKPGSSLKDALRGSLSNTRARSRSNSLGSRRCSSPRSQQDFDPTKLTLESGTSAAKSISRIVEASMKSPMDFTLAIARGFHNAPKLYGDDTVRPQDKVTDLQSGLKAAGKEFGYGMFDGITGLVTQPLRGAEKEGISGFVKGIGKGIAGVALKPGAAIWGLPGYTFMGIHREVRKLFGSNILSYVIAARTAQGFEDSQSVTSDERVYILQQWADHKAEYQDVGQRLRQKEPEGEESGQKSPKGFWQTRHLSFDERKKLHEDREQRRKEGQGKVTTELAQHTNHPVLTNDAQTSTPTGLSSYAAPSDVSNENMGPELEHAIHASVEETSRGNPEEDIMIERAIRASMRELERGRSAAFTDQEALDRAIQASIAEASQDRSGKASTVDNVGKDQEYQAMLEKAIQESLQACRVPAATNSTGTIQSTDAVTTLEPTQASLPPQPTSKDSNTLTEEDIILEYMKKQSLAEERLKQHAAGQKARDTANDADEGFGLATKRV